jgi:hypothetical protein
MPKSQKSSDQTPRKAKGPSSEKNPEKGTRSVPLAPAKKKIGEDDDNLRAREEAFKRRRDTTG